MKSYFHPQVPTVLVHGMSGEHGGQLASYGGKIAEGQILDSGLDLVKILLKHQ